MLSRFRVMAHPWRIRRRLLAFVRFGGMSMGRSPELTEGRVVAVTEWPRSDARRAVTLDVGDHAGLEALWWSIETCSPTFESVEVPEARPRGRHQSCCTGVATRARGFAEGKKRTD
jgi:hypothetical protein